jgi:hypothetical protein
METGDFDGANNLLDPELLSTMPNGLEGFDMSPLWEDGWSISGGARPESLDRRSLVFANTMTGEDFLMVLGRNDGGWLITQLGGSAPGKA